MPAPGLSHEASIAPHAVSKNQHRCEGGSRRARRGARAQLPALGADQRVPPGGRAADAGGRAVAAQPGPGAVAMPQNGSPCSKESQASLLLGDCGSKQVLLSISQVSAAPAAGELKLPSAGDVALRQFLQGSHACECQGYLRRSLWWRFAWDRRPLVTVWCQNSWAAAHAAACPVHAVMESGECGCAARCGWSLTASLQRRRAC